MPSGSHQYDHNRLDLPGRTVLSTELVQSPAPDDTTREEEGIPSKSSKEASPLGPLGVLLAYSGTKPSGFGACSTSRSLPTRNLPEILITSNEVLPERLILLSGLLDAQRLAGHRLRVWCLPSLVEEWTKRIFVFARRYTVSLDGHWRVFNIIPELLAWYKDFKTNTDSMDKTRRDHSNANGDDCI
jgi:hypothetical protein